MSRILKSPIKVVEIKLQAELDYILSGIKKHEHPINEEEILQIFSSLMEAAEVDSNISIEVLERFGDIGKEKARDLKVKWEIKKEIQHKRLTMNKKEEVRRPNLGMFVFHESIYDGKELLKVVGIRNKEIELEGDYSGGTHNVIQKAWLPIKGTFRLRKVCEEKAKPNGCQLHNLHCGYPNCEPYTTTE
jgi:hypothetical protein